MAGSFEQEEQRERSPARPVPAGPAPAATMDPGAPGRQTVLAMRATAGNAAVAAALAPDRAGRPASGVERAVVAAIEEPAIPTDPESQPRPLEQDTPAPPSQMAAVPERAAATPTDDPRFQKVAGTVRRVARSERKHVPAGQAATEAHKAAAPPVDDKEAKAAASQVSTMAAQKPGEFDKARFIAAVRTAIEAKSPSNLEEADEFAKSGKAGEVKAEVGGMVAGGKNTAASAITSATAAAPDQGRVASKEAVPMREEVAGPAPPPVDGAAAMPAPRPKSATDLSAGPAEVSATMASGKVTDEQLAVSNEPQFTQALQSRRALEAHAAAAPAAARGDEKAILDNSRTEAGASSQAGVGAMRAKRAGSVTKVNRQKEAAKAKAEARQAEFATKLKATYEATKTEVTAILEGLDAKVGAAFDAGEADARHQFEKQVADEMKAFRDKRYDGIDGAARWAWDKLTSPPPEVNQIFERARAAYLARMNAVISSVADLVGAELGKAKARIARGKADVSQLVAELPKNLRKDGAAAAEKVQGDFDSLSSDVESKQDGLVDDLAQRYTAAAGAVNARVDQLKSENKGLLDKAKDAVAGAVETILKLKDMLLGVLARAAGAIDTIISKPIEFLGNLIAAVKGGLDAFVANIGTHLQNGLLGWLTGALGQAGVTMPDKLDLRGIVGLVLQILGLTWANIRGRIARAIGEPAMAAVEQGVEVVKTIITEGPAGLWKWVVEKLSNLEEMVIGAIKDFVITRVITAGVTWLISLLNPAAAFIKACKAIYDIVMFFIDRGSQIMEFVNSILDSIGSIASGALGGAVSYIEQTLAKALPVAISFLASLLGLDGIGEKVRGIIAKVQAPINKVIDGIVGGVVKMGKKLWGKVKGAFGRGKKDEKTSPEVMARWNSGMGALRRVQREAVTRKLTGPAIKSRLAEVKDQYGFRSIEAEERSTGLAIVADMNPNNRDDPLLIDVQGDDSEPITLVVTVADQSVSVQIKDSPDTPPAVVDRHGGKHKVLMVLADMFDEVTASNQSAARQLLSKLEQLKITEVRQVRALMIAFAHENKGGGFIDPVEFATKRLKLGKAISSAALTRPVDDETRSQLVNLGRTPEGEQRKPLSNIAQVFYEGHRGQFQSRPHQAGLIEYIYRETGVADVTALGTVRVDEQGRIESIVNVNPPMTEEELRTLMQAANWRFTPAK